jgi:hypothetical protein
VTEIDPRCSEPMQELEASNTGREFDASGEQTSELVGLALALVQPLERALDRGVRRTQLEEPFEKVDRSIRLARQVSSCDGRFVQ